MAQDGPSAGASAPKPHRRVSPRGAAPGASARGHSTGHSDGYLGAVPPPQPPPGGGGWTYIERPDDLARVAQRLAQLRVLAIDAEFVQTYHRGPDDPPHRLALLQVAGAPGDDGAFVIDALRLPDLTPLQQALGDPAILKLFHGIGADERVLATRGLVARHTLDLEAVSRSIFGSRESSLRSMLLRACGVRLDKSLQRSDWTRRPLPPAMLAYAARDAQMTLALYHWLAPHYPWAIALYEVPAKAMAPEVAAWIMPLVEGPRAQRTDWAVAQAGLEDDRPRQVADLRAALAVVRVPAQRARVLRLIGELGLIELAPDLRPLLADQASEIRTSTARALGRMRDTEAEPPLRALLADPVQDVRDAAAAGLESLVRAPRASAPTRVRRATGAGAVRWTVNEPERDTTDEAPWQAALRARFAADTTGAGDPPGGDEDPTG